MAMIPGIRTTQSTEPSLVASVQMLHGSLIRLGCRTHCKTWHAPLQSKCWPLAPLLWPLAWSGYDRPAAERSFRRYRAALPAVLSAAIVFYNVAHVTQPWDIHTACQVTQLLLPSPLPAAWPGFTAATTISSSISLILGSITSDRWKTPTVHAHRLPSPLPYRHHFCAVTVFSASSACFCAIAAAYAVLAASAAVYCPFRLCHFVSSFLFFYFNFQAKCLLCFFNTSCISGLVSCSGVLSLNCISTLCPSACSADCSNPAEMAERLHQIFH